MKRFLKLMPVVLLAGLSILTIKTSIIDPSNNQTIKIERVADAQSEHDSWINIIKPGKSILIASGESEASSWREIIRT